MDSIKYSEEFIDRVRKASVEAIDVLLHIAKNPDKGEFTRTNASRIILQQHTNCIEFAKYEEILSRLEALEGKIK